MVLLWQKNRYNHRHYDTQIIQLVHKSRITVYRAYSSINQCVLKLKSVWRYVIRHGSDCWRTGQQRENRTSVIWIIYYICTSTFECELRPMWIHLPTKNVSHDGGSCCTQSTCAQRQRTGKVPATVNIERSTSGQKAKHLKIAVMDLISIRAT